MTVELGAKLEPEGTRFSVWTTRASRVAVVLLDASGTVLAEHPLESRGKGEHEALVPRVGAGARYRFRLDDQELPDPYARELPEGVHGPAVVVDPVHEWRYSTRRASLTGGFSIYELHVGTFSPEGTFAGARAKLPEIAALGVEAIELLPLSSFPGRRGWGYDGVAHFAPHAAYGTPTELRELVDEAHHLGLAVLLDVVYNHFGPDGNYLAAYSPEYFTSRHQTPWGNAPDFAEPHMRRLVLDNARYWLESFRFDGLRLDAIHQITDEGPQPILRELAQLAHGLAGAPLLIAEDERRGARTVTELGLDGYWADAFHHRVHVLCTGEKDGYYAGYQGGVADLARLLVTDAGSHTREVSGAAGSRAVTTPVRIQQLVYCIQNHDQIGNRALGERFAMLTSPETQQAMATLLLFLPATPLIFQGEEWAASSPFLYFTDHDPELGEAVSRGRREEFRAFPAFANPETRARIPDPQALETFERSRLDWSERDRQPHAAVLERYRRLLELRRTDRVLADHSDIVLEAGAAGDVLWVRRSSPRGTRVCLVSFGGTRRGLDTLGVPGEPLGATDLVTGQERRELRPFEAAVLTPADEQRP